VVPVNGVRLIGKSHPPEAFERDLFLAVVDDVGTWSPDLSQIRSPFIVLTAFDAAALHYETLCAFADRLIRAGCRYACTWGQGCGSVHDAFDTEAIRAGLDGEGENFVMTTRHDDESLDDALEFALFHAWTWDPGFPDTVEAGSVLAVASADYSADVERRLADVKSFAEERFSDESP